MALPLRTLSWTGVIGRFVLALMLVLATYNPDGYSYVQWALLKLPDFGPLQAFSGVVLIIGWSIYLRATFNALGRFGTLLALAFFASLFWLAARWDLLPIDSMRAMLYLLLVGLAAFLTTGVVWSFFHSWFTGQADVDEVDS